MNTELRSPVMPGVISPLFLLRSLVSSASIHEPGRLTASLQAEKKKSQTPPRFLAVRGLVLIPTLLLGGWDARLCLALGRS